MAAAAAFDTEGLAREFQRKQAEECAESSDDDSEDSGSWKSDESDHDDEGSNSAGGNEPGNGVPEGIQGSLHSDGQGEQHFHCTELQLLKYPVADQLLGARYYRSCE